jgi:hypothetical protein
MAARLKFDSRKKLSVRSRRVGESPDKIGGYHGCPPHRAVVALNCGENNPETPPLPAPGTAGGSVDPTLGHSWGGER